MNRREWAAALAVLDKEIGRKKTELGFRSHFQFAVAVIMSAQATDKSVNLATPALFKAAPTPAAMVRLGEAGVARFIKTIGLWRAKSHNIVAMSEKLLSEHGGQLPRTREELMSLPGIGRKSANVIMNELWGAPTIGVDTHVLRLARRLGIDASGDPLAVEMTLEKITPAEYKPYVSNFLVLFGRYRCKAVRPECGGCKLARWCDGAV